MTRSTPRDPAPWTSSRAGAGAGSLASPPASSASAPLRTLRRVPAPAFVVVGMASTQTGAAIAKTLFDELGPAATAFLRVALAAVLLALIWRSRVVGHSRRDLGLAVAFGLVHSAMNLTFYEA